MLVACLDLAGVLEDSLDEEPDEDEVKSDAFRLWEGMMVMLWVEKVRWLVLGF